MKIDTSNWTAFKMSALFNIKGVRTVTVETLETNYTGGHFPYITRTEKNNGFSGYYDYKTAPANVLTIETTLSGLCYFHEYEFSTGDHIAVLFPKGFELNRSRALFIKAVWRKNAYKYDYGRPATIKRIKETYIVLPSKNGKPDWEYIENYVKSLESKIQFTDIATENQRTNQRLNMSCWQEFQFDELFDIAKGKRLTKANMIEGDIPFIGASAFNNGITAFVDVDHHIHPGNTITIAYNGSVGNAFYQPVDFFACDDVNVLHPKFKLNRYIAFFLITMIEQLRNQFGFGRKWNLERMLESQLKLPVDKAGQPDWQFMENYIKSLPYADLI
jgi:hypothetical protein